MFEAVTCASAFCQGIWDGDPTLNLTGPGGRMGRVPDAVARGSGSDDGGDYGPCQCQGDWEEKGSEIRGWI